MLMVRPDGLYGDIIGKVAKIMTPDNMCRRATLCHVDASVVAFRQGDAIAVVPWHALLRVEVDLTAEEWEWRARDG